MRSWCDLAQAEAGCIPVFSGCDEVKSSRREAVGRAALNDVLHALLLEKTRSGALTNVCVEIRRGDRVISHMCANQCCNEGSESAIVEKCVKWEA